MITSPNLTTFIWFWAQLPSKRILPSSPFSQAMDQQPFFNFSPTSFSLQPPSVFHQLMVIVIPSCILPTPGIDLEKCSSTLFLNSRTLIWSSLHFKTQGVPELTYLGVTSENYWSPGACYSDAFIIFLVMEFHMILKGKFFSVLKIGHGVVNNRAVTIPHLLEGVVI